MPEYEFFLASSLEKVFPSRRPQALIPGAQLSVWRGTRAAVQLIYTARAGAPGMPVQRFSVEVAGAPAPAVLRSVELVPSDYPCYEDVDTYYITKEPGLFPDLLSPLATPLVMPLPRQYRSVWLSWDIPADTEPGRYLVTVTARALAQETQPNGTVFTDPAAAGLTYENSFVLCVGRAALPAQTLIHTEWFHTDSLAQYYGVPPFSEEHWRIVEEFIRAAAEHGINMLLTPVFTPPLDTAVGARRMTVQLVDVRRDAGIYTFGFEKLARWTKLCKRHGVEYLEIPHLFTQWGALATPQIMAAVDGEEKRIFGWDVPAQSGEYRAFLCAFLPALRTELARLGYGGSRVYYHISDEPAEAQLASYRAARAQVADLLDGCQVIDALSSFSFYQEGLVPTPVCATDHLRPFFDAGVPELWVYYCCGQSNLVPNRFFAMESARNRIMGVLMYLYGVKGFLHWGYNFYSAKFSLRPIDPYRVTHADYGFPSGDAFLVYPGPDGKALSSVRAEVQDDALLDLRALQYLEKLAGRDFTVALIDQESPAAPMTFTDYPRSPDYLLALRERVAQDIEQRSPRLSQP